MSVTLRDAATVMLVRDADDGRGGPAVEVCMLRRNLASEFVAGAYVFPGGSVDPEDRGPRAAALCQGRTDDEASAILGVESGGLAFWVAALRECFEEAGVLVARPVDHGADRAPTAARHLRRRTVEALRRPPGCRQRAAHRSPRHLRRGGPGPGRRRHALHQPLDHPRAGPPALRHPLLHHRGPSGPGGQPRRRGDHRHHLGAARPRRWPARRPARSSCCPPPSPTFGASRPSGRPAR